jgi:hypothetical protein
VSGEWRKGSGAMSKTEIASSSGCWEASSILERSGARESWVSNIESFGAKFGCETEITRGTERNGWGWT